MSDSLQFICGIEEVGTLLGVTSLTDSQKALLNLIRPIVEQTIKDEIGNDVLYGTKVEYLPDNDRRSPIDPLLTDIRLSSSGSSFAFSSRDRTDCDILQLKHVPVYLDSTLEVREDFGAMGGQASGAFGSSTILTRGTDYYLDVEGSSNISYTGHLRRRGSWSTQARTIKITYHGGWQRADLDSGKASKIKLAAILTCQAALIQAKHLAQGGPIISEMWDGEYSVTYAQQAIQLLAGMAVDMPPQARMLISKHEYMGRIFA